MASRRSRVFGAVIGKAGGFSSSDIVNDLLEEEMQLNKHIIQITVAIVAIYFNLYNTFTTSLFLIYVYFKTPSNLVFFPQHFGCNRGNANCQAFPLKKLEFLGQAASSGGRWAPKTRRMCVRRAHTN